MSQMKFERTWNPYWNLLEFPSWKQVKTNEVKQKLMFRDSTLLSNELNETDTKIINAMSLEAATVAGARCKLRCYEADEMSIFAWEI